jgi:hypothetical protein
MKHYRILERKGDKKEYIIQYLKKFIFGLYYWKKLEGTYVKYEEAFNFAKKLINQEDYDNANFGYHYIDAYKIFKTQTKEVQKEIIKETPTKTKFVLNTEQSKSKSTFVPRQQSDKDKKVNKSVFIPRQ